MPKWKVGDFVRVCYAEGFYTGMVMEKRVGKTVVLFDEDNETTLVDDKNVEFFD
jgi:hypothetical protein